MTHTTEGFPGHRQHTLLGASDLPPVAPQLSTFSMYYLSVAIQGGANRSRVVGEKEVYYIVMSIRIAVAHDKLCRHASAMIVFGLKGRGCFDEYGYDRWLRRWSDCSYGVMVSTLDFESSDPGSNPGRS